jgi:hypothetical protein
MSVFAFSCATTETTHPAIQLPAIYQPMFRSCEISDGEAQLRLIEAGKPERAVTLVWNFASTNDGAIQVNSPLGDSMLEIAVKSHAWKVDGSMDLEISERQRGELSINGHDIPVRGGEIACLLAGAWPEAWLKILRPATIKANERLYYGRESLRDIDFTFYQKGAAPDFRQTDFHSCAVIRWGGFWGFFRREAQICRSQNDQGVLMRMTGIGEITVEWVIRDDA